MKIYIIGPAGSGKTTLAKELSRRLNLPHFDLDEIFWDTRENSFGVKREESVRNDMYKRILEGESWIIEGAYLFWPSEGFRQADKLVFLNERISLLNFRIIRRFLRRKKGDEYSKKKETWRGLIKLIVWNKKQTFKMRKYFLSQENYLPNLINLNNKKKQENFWEELIPKSNN